MWAGGTAAAAAQRNDVAACNGIAYSYFDLRQMHVYAHQAEAVVDHDAAALKIKRSCQHDAARVDRRYLCSCLSVKIQSAMHACDFSVEDAARAEAVRLRSHL